MGYTTGVTKCTVVLPGTSNRTDDGYPVTGLRKTRDHVSAKGNSGGLALLGLSIKTS